MGLQAQTEYACGASSSRAAFRGKVSQEPRGWRLRRYGCCGGTMHVIGEDRSRGSMGYPDERESASQRTATRAVEQSGSRRGAADARGEGNGR